MAATGAPEAPRAAPPSVLHSATLADVLADKHAAMPDRRSVLLLEHNMTVADALEVPPRGCAAVWRHARCVAAAAAPRADVGTESASR
jgi:hypothetical protein